MKLSEAKKKGKLHHYPYHGNPGRQCNRCYQKALKGHNLKRPATESCSAVSSTKRVRRTHSDPGQSINITHKRTRAHPLPPIPITKKMRVKIAAPGDASLLLDILHIRRLQLIEAEKNGTHTIAPNSSTTLDGCWI